MSLVNALITSITVGIFPITALAGIGKTNPECPAHGLIPEALINPVGLKSYLNNNSNTIKSIDDFICCLPKSYRQNYVIAHTSKAAQNSTFTSPRILLFNPLRPHPSTNARWRKPLQAVLSINGGDAELNQANSIEMLYDNPQRRELEFFDIENSHSQFHMSGKNPEVCMFCHANGSPPGLGGPKTIFDPSLSWPRFIKGISPCTDGERELMAAIEKVSERHFRANKRFRCLDPKPNAVNPFQTNGVRPSFMLNDFDEALADLNDRRVAKTIQSTPQYDKYKFVVLGALVCDQENYRISEWLPASILQTHNSDFYLLPEVRHSTDLNATAQAVMKRYASEAKELEVRQKEFAARILAGEKPNIEFNTHPIGCENDSLDRKLREIRESFTGPDILNKYRLDTSLRGFRRSTANPELRFLFEGRGISTADWSMDPVAGRYSRGHDMLAHHLVSSEPAGSPIKDMEQQLFKQGLLNSSQIPMKPSTDPDVRASLCAQLRAHSIKAFASDGFRSQPPTSKTKTVN